MARYALVIGISKYDNLRNLDKAAADASAITHILQSHGQYQVEPLPKRLIEAENRWELATDKKLTAKDLGQSLETFLLERAKDQEALIYFAGHGFEVPGLGRKKKGYLATSDASADGRNAILFSDLNDLIRESSLSSLVLILDCCHAGSFLERTMLESTLTAFREKKDYYLITASRSFERAREGEEHGVFTAAVLKGLQAENADREGNVTGDRLFDFIQGDLRQSGQEPIRMGMGRSLTLVSYPLQPKNRGSTEPQETISAPPRLPLERKRNNLLGIAAVSGIAVVGVGVIALLSTSKLAQNPLDILQSSDLDKIAEKMPAIKQAIDQEMQKVDTLPAHSDLEDAIADYNARKVEINKSLVLHQLFLQKIADLRERGELTSENSQYAQNIEDSLGLMIHKYRIPFLAVDLQQHRLGQLNEESDKTDPPNKQFKPGALQTTYEILMTESGAHADLNGKGTIENPKEANQIPCRSLIEIKDLWKKATDQKCDWYGKDVNNPHIDPECQRQIRKYNIHPRASTLATLISENYPDELVSRVKYCEEKPSKTNN